VPGSLAAVLAIPARCSPQRPDAIRHFQPDASSAHSGAPNPPKWPAAERGPMYGTALLS
jgi:hypothetical protein